MPQHSGLGGGRAGEKHIVVVGGGIAGLTVALECAKVGLAVTVLEASDHLGGTVRAIDVAGLRLDAVVEGWRIGGGARARPRDRPGSRRRDRPGRRRRRVDRAPATDRRRRCPAARWPGSRRTRGTRASAGSSAGAAPGARTSTGCDPRSRSGRSAASASSCASRMGDAVLDRMVAPLSLGAYGIHPDDVDVEAAAPGLSTALTRMGSLSGGVAQLLVDDPGPGVEGLAGGTFLLVDALRARLTDLGADLRTGTRVDRLERTRRRSLGDRRR